MRFFLTDVIPVLCFFVFPLFLQTIQGKDQYIVGGLAITGSAKLFQQWNSTFATYLTAALRQSPKYANITFKLVSLDFYSTFTMVISVLCSYDFQLCSVTTGCSFLGLG